MVKLAHPGEFCPNSVCPDYGKLQNDQVQPNIKKIGKTPNGAQRYQCKTCQKTFTETRGTIFYRKQAKAEQILEVLALIAEGNRISTLTRVKGIKEDTILNWLREAAHHVEELNPILMKDFHLKRAQLDGLWSFVQNKGEKKLSRNG